MPRFSIVIPCFNAASTLAETLDSIRAQSFQDWEAICVDDGSSDLTQALITDYAKIDPRVRLAFNPQKGPAAARNFGAFHLAKGEFIAFCDADDVWSAGKLSEQLSAFSDVQIDGVFGQIAFFEGCPASATVFSTVPSRALAIGTLLGENPVCTMSNLTIRRESLWRYGAFDPKVVHNEDLEWLIRIVGQGAQIRGQDILQVWYRNSPTGLSANLGAMEEGRVHALSTAARFGVEATRQAEAIHNRYLARRALRMGQGRVLAAKFACRGMLQSPAGFFSPPKRGALTLAGALSNLVLPRQWALALFSK